MRVKRPQALLAALLLSASAVAHAADTDAEFRLNEVLTDEEYRETWQELVEDELRLPEWVMNLTGKGAPMKAVESKDGKYLVGRLCDEHDCFHQRLYVAFSWDKDKVYALYVQVPQGMPADKTPSRHASFRWLGEPDEEQKRLLDEQLSADPDWH